jgi:predicted nucleic acid-binding protein
MDRYFADGDTVVASSLGRIETNRVLRALLAGTDNSDVTDAIAVAMSGVSESPMTEDVLALAQRVPPAVLRTLDAIHLATAILLEVDVVVTYDTRFADACRHTVCP